MKKLSLICTGLVLAVAASSGFAADAKKPASAPAAAVPSKKAEKHASQPAVKTHKKVEVKK